MTDLTDTRTALDLAEQKGYQLSGELLKPDNVPRIIASHPQTGECCAAAETWAGIAGFLRCAPALTRSASGDHG